MNARTAAAIKEIVALLKEATQPEIIPGLGGMTPDEARKLETLLHEMADGIKLDTIEPSTSADSYFGGRALGPDLPVVD